MQTLVKGQNVALAALGEHTDSVTLALHWTDVSGTGDADVSVLLVGPDGKVGGDDDLYFYNHRGEATDPVQLLDKTPTDSGVEDRISIDLACVPDRVERIVVSASRDPGRTFGELDALGLTLSDSGGERVLRFDIDDATTETAFIFGELYRRAGEWKFRAVGQGYASGLAGLVTDFGIQVDDADEPGPDGDTGARDEEPEAPPASEASPAAAPAAPRVTASDPVTAAIPAPREPRRVRTRKQPRVLPKLPRQSLGEDSWRDARLFPVTGGRNDQEKETRATSVLLSVMAQVPVLARRLLAKVNAPTGKAESFTEVTFTHGDAKVRPDGVLRISRGGRLWTALVETKTGGNPLKPEQVQAYVDVAGRSKFDAVITISNDLTVGDRHPVMVGGRYARKVALRHLSWAEITHEAHMLCHHEGVDNPAHLWLLEELLHFLRHDNSGCKGFENMGRHWVPVREAVTAGTLRPGDQGASHVAESWEKLVRQLCLRLSGELGSTVSPVMRGRRGRTAEDRLTESADLLCTKGQLSAELKVPHFVGTVELVANLQTSHIEVSATVPAPATARQLTKVTWLTRSLGDNKPDLRIEGLVDQGGPGPCELLRHLEKEPAKLLPDEGNLTGFVVTARSPMGSRRGTEETGFIRSVDKAFDEFYQRVLQDLKEPKARAGAADE